MPDVVVPETGQDARAPASGRNPSGRGGPGATVTTRASAGSQQGVTSSGTGASSNEGKGLNSTKLSIGISWFDLAALTAITNGPLGGDGSYEGSGTTKDYAQAVVDYLNAHGGIAGRTISPVYHEIPINDLLDPRTRAREEQRMCATYTQDHKVFAMLPILSTEGVLMGCAKETDTPMIAVGNTEWSLDEESFAEFGQWWYRPNWMAGGRREKTMVDRLVAQDFFDPEAKIGIMVEDKPHFRRPVDRALVPGLEAAGVNVASVIAYPDEVQSPWQNYVLQMQTAGVTHVVWAGCACGGASAAFFMRAAEDQRFRPRYALATDTNLSGVAALGAPDAQLKDAGGIGWAPPFDRYPQHYREPPMNDSEALCRTIAAPVMQERGESEAPHAMLYCEGLFFLKAALERSPAFDSVALAEAVAKMGDRYVPVITPAAQFGPDRHDGPAQVSDIGWDGECRCFIYRGGLHPAAS